MQKNTEKKIKILVLNGPNLNMLGHRDPVYYGRLTLDKLNKLIRQKAQELNVDIKFYQTNHEGNLVTLIQRQRKYVDGILLNAGAYTHTSIAIRDAIELIKIPVVEVHLSDINAREPFRRVSLIHDVCIATFSGEKEQSYLKGLEFLVNKIRTENL
ncbi:MAG: type II 3-dehydroquinate dehydratase [Candidatus Marinimicrobia bacterium]|nr:type II 3-dehydroquinate dehydratase [Candidatus Neomarinimicrobiota bacterium]MDD5582077.1 type II 3-dehydroquinate dehydratase [Candidatus Neomarinimicrobiota bacterium]